MRVTCNSACAGHSAGEGTGSGRPCPTGPLRPVTEGHAGCSLPCGLALGPTLVLRFDVGPCAMLDEKETGPS